MTSTIIAGHPCFDLFRQAEKRTYTLANELIKSIKKNGHFCGQKYEPLLEIDDYVRSVAVPLLHCGMGIFRQLTNPESSKVTNKVFEAFIAKEYHLYPSKPISGSTLKNTNVLSYTGKDVSCISSFARLDADKWAGVGINCYVPQVLSLWADIRDLFAERVCRDDWSFEIRQKIVMLRSVYHEAKFQPTLILHIICQHLADFAYVWESYGGVWSLSEETVESSD
jgi:hypothetical protein